MPVVTDQLFHYWNGKDGIKTGNVLANLAPGQAAKNLTVVGGSLQANGAIRCDGVDDYFTASFSGANYETRGAPFTLEILMSPRVWSGNREILDGGIYLVYENGNLESEVAHDNNTQATYPSWEAFPGLNTTALVLMTFVYGGGTNMKVYANGTLFANTTLTATTAIAAQGYTRFDLFRGVYAGLFGADLHAVRLYKKALSAAEVTQNWNNGIDIGLAAPVAPKIKYGEYRAAGGVNIPVYGITDHPTQSLRVRVNGLTTFIETVPVTDPAASKIRIKTPAGILALKL